MFVYLDRCHFPFSQTASSRQHNAKIAAPVLRPRCPSKCLRTFDIHIQHLFFLVSVSNRRGLHWTELIMWIGLYEYDLCCVQCKCTFMQNTNKWFQRKSSRIECRRDKCATFDWARWNTDWHYSLCLPIFFFIMLSLLHAFTVGIRSDLIWVDGSDSMNSGCCWLNGIGKN